MNPFITQCLVISSILIYILTNVAVGELEGGRQQRASSTDLLVSAANSLPTKRLISEFSTAQGKEGFRKFCVEMLVLSFVNDVQMRSLRMVIHDYEWAVLPVWSNTVKMHKEGMSWRQRNE